MDMLNEIEHQIKYGTTAATLDANDKARVLKVFEGTAASDIKRTADRNKQAAKKVLAVQAQTAAQAPVVPLAVVPGVPKALPKKKRVIKPIGEVYQSVADKKRAERNAAEEKIYCQYEIGVHKKLIAAEITQNQNKIYQLNLHEMELIRRTHEHALKIIQECKSMSSERKTQAKKYVEGDKKAQENAVSSRWAQTARVLTHQVELHRGHFKTEEGMNTNLCNKKAELTKEYNETKHRTFAGTDFSHIVNFTRLDKSHFEGDTDKSIYKNFKTHMGIPAHRPRTVGG